MTAERLRAYVGASSSDAEYVAECYSTAAALVAARVAFTPVPQAILDRATLEVGSELYHRRNAPNGVAQFATMDGGAPIRVARDPMVAAAALLAPYLGVPFA